MKKKLLYVFGVILLLLIITNPSQKAFKEYLGNSGYGGLKRESNFFICSIYKRHTETYFAMVGNFFKLEPKVWTPPATDQLLDSAKMDSAKVDTSAPPLPRGYKKIDTTSEGLPLFKKK